MRATGAAVAECVIAEDMVMVEVMATWTMKTMDIIPIEYPYYLHCPNKHIPYYGYFLCDNAYGYCCACSATIV